MRDYLKRYFNKSNWECVKKSFRKNVYCNHKWKYFEFADEILKECPKCDTTSER
jgi:hypothetical protein